MNRNIYLVLIGLVTLVVLTRNVYIDQKNEKKNQIQNLEILIKENNHK